MPNLSKEKLATLKPRLAPALPTITTISPAELAALLDKSQDTIHRLHERGQGPPRFRIGKTWHYRVIDVENWLADRLRTEASRSRRLRKLVAGQQPENNPNEAA